MVARLPTSRSFGVCGCGRHTGITYLDFLTGCSKTITKMKKKRICNATKIVQSWWGTSESDVEFEVLRGIINCITDNLFHVLRKFCAIIYEFPSIFNITSEFPPSLHTSNVVVKSNTRESRMSSNVFDFECDRC